MNDLEAQLGKGDRINLTLLKQLLSEQQKIPRTWVNSLTQRYLSLLKHEPNVVHIQEPVIVVGDIHGQFFDLLKIISLFPSSLESQPKQTMLFLGDYVDRGPMGVEVMILLMAIKIKYPKKTVMLRGNHQTRLITQAFSFYRQICQKYDHNLYFLMMDTFDALPLVCIINKSYFCVHGGLTTHAQSLQALAKLDRFIEVPDSGSICDLLWADPVDNDNGATETAATCLFNTQRGCSIYFGAEHTREFLKRQKMVTVIRAHQVQLQGYKQHFWPKWKDIPMVYTLFSAPNYCGNYGNLGAILTIIKSQFNIRQYKETNPKYYLPAKYNAFNFSIGLIEKQSTRILQRIIKRWVSSKMPEFKHIDIDTLADVYLKSDHCKKLKAKEELATKKKIGKVSREFSEAETFKKSQSYYFQTEKRPKKLPVYQSLSKG